VQELPGPLRADVALLLELDLEEVAADHRLSIVLLDEDDKKVAQLAAELTHLEVTPEVGGFEPRIPVANIPLAVPTSAFVLERAGAHRLVVTVDGGDERTLWFQVNSTEGQEQAAPGGDRL
jgi:hypothetical protein